MDWARRITTGHAGIVAVGGQLFATWAVRGRFTAKPSAPPMSFLWGARPRDPALRARMLALRRPAAASSIQPHFYRGDRI
jgi:hypothetical protein